MEPIKISLSMSTTYLLPALGGYLQVDTGYERDYSLYRAKLEKLGVPVGDIRYLILTHHHDDHAGFLNDLTRDTSLTIIAHEKARELLKTGANDKSCGGGYVNSFVRYIADAKMQLDPRWTLTFPPFDMRPSDLLIGADDDASLRCFGVAGKLLYTPGHSIDHLTVLLDTGEVFCGDAAASFLLIAGIKYCTVFMTNMKDAYRSWQKILDAGGRMIYPAHGKPFPARKLVENMGKIRTQDLVKFF